MNQSDTVNETSPPSLLDLFGNPVERVEAALEQMRAGGGVLVVDDEDRENEGDIIFAADTLTNEQMALMIRECSGIVCLCLTQEKAESLNLPPMVQDNRSSMGTAFTVTIEAAEGVTTGVSAADRVTTIKAAIGHNAVPSALVSPGHVFPLRAQPNGVLDREGHTEATVDLARLSGHSPSGVLCELTNPDGTMARLPEIVRFARAHDMPVMSVADLIEYRRVTEGEAAA